MIIYIEAYAEALFFGLQIFIIKIHHIILIHIYFTQSYSQLIFYN